MKENDSALRAAQGDRIVIRGHHVGELERDAEILEVLGEGGSPPYVVRWEDDGHVSRLYPSSDAYVQHFEHPQGAPQASEPPHMPRRPKMTSTAHVDVIDRSVEKTNIWLRDMAAELDSDRPEAYRSLRAVLHTLRDRLTVDEAAQLAAQLPLLVRGIYYDGWDPSGTPARYSHAQEFLDRVAHEAKLAGDTEASYAVAAAARVLRTHVSEGELEDVMAVLPHEVRRLMEP